MILMLKHLIVAWERDVYLNSRHRSLFVELLRRPNAPEGEHVFRLRLRISLLREPRISRPWFDLQTIPAWSEVPSVLAEYQRTMKPFEIPRIPWYLRERRNAVN